MCLHTMKTFELAIASACVISNFSEEQNAFFPNNDSMIYFNTKNEMLKKINLFLLDSNKNMEIRRNAFLKAKSHYYHARCISLINYIKSI